MSRRMRRRLATQRYEAGEARAAASVVKAGDVVLELGSGLGFISSYLRKHTPAGRIVCVEANPHLIPYIQRVHQLNAVFEAKVIHGIASASDGDAAVPFYCRRDFWASSLAPEPAYEHVASVPAIPFSKLVSEHRPDILVMDIEGGEHQLLAVQAIDGVRAVVLEVHPVVYGEAGVRVVRDHLARLSFQLVAEYDRGSVLVYQRAG